MNHKSSKHFRAFNKKYSMKHSKRSFAKRLRKHPAFFVPALTFSFLLCVTVIAILVVNRGSNPIPVLAASDTKIAIVTADKAEQIVPTRADSVGELLERLEITLNDGDVVEPALDSEIISDNFKVNVYRAKPVTIVDGDKEIRALSAATTPRSIASQAGIETYAEDIVTLNPAEDFLTDGIIGQRLHVKRSIPINLNLFGTEFEVRTHAKTVEEFLEEKNIELKPGETVQPTARSPINPDNPIYVSRKGVKVETVSREIPYDRKITEDKTLTFGVEVVRQRGEPGRRVVTYQINTITGERTKFHEVVVRQPITEVVARGAYVNVPNDKQSVMAAAGISPSDYSYVDFIIARESSWNAAAVNSSSGATGLCQALPGSKMATAGDDWATNPVTQLRWCNSYAIGRYGSWAAAYSFWQRNHWW